MATKKVYYRIIKEDVKAGKKTVVRDKVSLQGAKEELIYLVNGIKKTRFRTWNEVQKYNAWTYKDGVNIGGYWYYFEKI